MSSTLNNESNSSFFINREIFGIYGLQVAADPVLALISDDLGLRYLGDGFTVHSCAGGDFGDGEAGRFADLGGGVAFGVHP